MLEQIRKSGASIFIYLIFGLLIVIFVINFAPNAGSGGGGCAGSSTSALTVAGVKTNQTAYKVAYSGNQASGRNKVYLALELLIRRELLAQAAEERGLRPTGDLLDEEIKKGVFFLGGNRNELGFWLDDIEGEKFFNFGKLKGWVNTLNVSMNSYKDEQTRGMQASMMSELLEESVRVSREEALSSYLFENNTVTYDAVAFSPRAYREAMRLTDADVARFLAGHEDVVKKKWTEVEREYKATKPALKLRTITIATAKPEPAAPAAPADQPGGAPPAPGEPSGVGPAPGAPAPGGGAPVTPPAAAKAPLPDDKTPKLPTVDEAKAKLEAARTAIAAGKQKFADAAQKLATDEVAKASGGNPRWAPVDNAQSGETAVNDAIKELKPGEMTPVIATDSGVYLVMAEDKREGDLTYDQVKLELATELAKDVWSEEAAKRAALDALAAARAGTGKNLGELFDREVNKEQQQRMFQEEIQRQMQQQQGSIVTESEDIPASWTAEDPAPTPSAGSGGGDTPPTAGAGGAGSATAGSAAAGSAAAGSAAAGSGAAPEAGTPTATEEKPPVELVASSDVLPSFANMDKPKVMSQGPVPRMKALPVVGDSKEAIGSLFDELSAGMLATKVYETDDAFVVLQLTEKSAPKVDDFDKVAAKEMEQLRAQRAAILVEQWLKQRCEQLAKDGKITPMQELIRETDDQGKPLPVVYRPCMSFR